MCKRFLALLTILAVAHTSSAEKRTIACKTPAVATSCYWTHGRLAIYDGGPPNVRLWKIGTNNLLGIYSGPKQFQQRYVDDADDSDPDLPPNLAGAFHTTDPFEIRVFADFEVCPLERHVPGHMQAACIESARHLVVTK